MNVIPQSLIICSNPIDGTTMKDADVQNYLFPKLFPHGHNPIYYRADFISASSLFNMRPPANRWDGLIHNGVSHE